MLNSFDARDSLAVGEDTYEIFRLDRIDGSDRLPYSLKVLLENLLRNEDGVLVTSDQVRAIADWDPAAAHGAEIQYTPARVLLQDFTGVPCVVDLVAMRDAMVSFGGDPQKINPLIPSELVIDHSVIVDAFGGPGAFHVNAELEFQRNQERYQLLRWAQQAFDDFLVVPPDTGICHQVNLEYLSRVVFTREGNDVTQAYPDTLVGTDSHTPMVNGLGVLGWGVGGIEAEAAMLGQPMSMLVPPVLGFKLTGELREGVTATDLVLTVAQRLRQTGVAKRNDRILRAIVDDLEGLRSSGKLSLTAEQLFESEEFFASFYTVFRASQETASEEKRQMLRNALLNGIDQRWSGEQAMFVRLVGVYDVEHVVVLRNLAKMSKGRTEMIEHA